MAETAPVWAILLAMQARLQEITVANGYRTDAGGDVRLEESILDAGQRITLYAANRVRPGDARSKSEREFTIIVEGQIPVDLDNTQELIVALDADIEQALEAYLPLPTALPLEFQESIVLPRPDGVPAMVVQHMYTTRYRR